MGVPAFFRWLSERYPKIIVDVIESSTGADGIEEKIDTSEPNPNGIEFDNLYLDMNGIIHPCSHPEDGKPPKSEEEIMQRIMEYIDRLFAIVRPRNLLYLAIDGVAPRAKMNQQRSRRFRAAKDAKEKKEIEERIRREQMEQGRVLVEEEEADKMEFDSNVITPGTPFMDKVAQALRVYVAQRLHSDPGWKNIKVILSDASVPGEGEHKIMEYIRRQRSMPDYNPNYRHVIYGLDADLIMLSLATHEPHFSILREVVTFGNNNNCYICGQPGHLAANCTGKAKEKQGEFDEKSVLKKPYQFLHVNILREYLEFQMKSVEDKLPFAYDFERIIDDWVFLCFFVGNDFLPHLPTLEIRENAIGLLTDIYKKVLPDTGYITEHGNIHFDRAQVLLQEIAQLEDNILSTRLQKERAIKARRKRRELEAKQRESGGYSPQFAPQPLHGTKRTRHEDSSPQLQRHQQQQQQQQQQQKKQQVQQRMQLEIQQKNLQAADMLRQALLAEEPVVTTPITTTTTTAKSTAVSEKSPQPPLKKRKSTESSAVAVEHIVAASSPSSSPPSQQSPQQSPQSSPPSAASSLLPSMSPTESSDTEEDEADDPVKLGEVGWRERYYKVKFGVEMSDTKFFKEFREAYATGLLWVFKYYYNGCASWQWFYPYHYAPFAAELIGIADLKIDFTLGTPFKPFEQLMGVLPAASGAVLPPAYRELMSDPDSPIIDFYPTDFTIDMNGKKQSWLGVALLPFIDEKRLLDALRPLEHTLTPEEVQRNSFYSDLLYVNTCHPMAAQLQSLYNKTEDKSTDTEWVQLDHTKGNMYGRIAACSQLPDSLPSDVIVVRYKDPLLPDGQDFKRGLLEGVIMPPRHLFPSDFENTNNRFRIQNHAMNRIINHYAPDSQHKGFSDTPRDPFGRDLPRRDYHQPHHDRYSSDPRERHHDDRYSNRSHSPSDRYQHTQSDNRYQQSDNRYQPRAHAPSDRYNPRQDRYSPSDRYNQSDRYSQSDRHNQSDNRYNQSGRYQQQSRYDNRSGGNERYSRERSSSYTDNKHHRQYDNSNTRDEESQSKRPKSQFMSQYRSSGSSTSANTPSTPSAYPPNASTAYPQQQYGNTAYSQSSNLLMMQNPSYYPSSLSYSSNNYLNYPTLQQQQPQPLQQPQQPLQQQQSSTLPSTTFAPNMMGIPQNYVLPSNGSAALQFAQLSNASFVPSVNMLQNTGYPQPFNVTPQSNSAYQRNQSNSGYQNQRQY